MAVYTNLYKGRANRTESATHLVDEFDRLEVAFALLKAKNVAYLDVFSQSSSTNNVLIDPKNGQMQEITLTQDTLIEIKDPGTGADSKSYRLTLLVHGSNFKIINGWGPQTWKEQGTEDWLWVYTGQGPKASALLEFSYDEKAWMCLAFSRNQPDTTDWTFTGTELFFPLLSDLADETAVETLVWSRSTYGYTSDEDATQIIMPPGQARFTGARHLKNWIATPKDLQSVAFTADNVTVATELNAGQDGNDVDKITFDLTGGQLQHWMLLNFGRNNEDASPIKFAISFDARMAGSITSGKCRALIAIMGVDSGSVVKWHRVSFDLTGAYQSFGAILDPVTGKNSRGFEIGTPAGARTLVKFAIESPSDGVGDPILVENVNVVVLKDGDAENVQLPVESTIGASIVLAKTSGSTGTWDNGTKTMTLAAAEYVDFQDSLTIGKAYLIQLSRTSGNTCDVLLENDRIYWKGNSGVAWDTSFVKDATFTVHYNGGVLKFLQASGTSVYSVDIYEISTFIGIFGTTNKNTISSGVITYAVGDKIQSNVAVGVAYEDVAATNLLDAEKHRDFSAWTNNGSLEIFRSEFGIDARPSHGSIVQDNKTSSAGYIEETVTIADDSSEYTFSFYIRKLFDSGVQVIFPEYNNTVTPASQYLDFQLKLTGGTEVAGEKVRLDLKAGTTSVTTNGYIRMSRINYQNWWKVYVSAKNNSSGNVTAQMRIYPSSATSATPGVLEASATGYIIIDWAQFEDSTVRLGSSSPCIPGETRAADSIASTLADGDLYTPAPALVGDLTATVFAFDTIDVYKNISWKKT